MEFLSIKDIQEYFGFESDDPVELRKLVMKEISKVHPDKSGGNFTSNKHKNDYDTLDKALKYIHNMNSNLSITNVDYRELMEKVEALSIIKKKEEVILDKEILNTLKDSIETSVIRFSKKHLAYKITSVTFLSIITALWTAPSFVQNNKNLKKIINPESLSFTIIWLGSLFVVIVFWWYILLQEQKDKVLKEEYALENTQNVVFKLFIVWLRISGFGSWDFVSDDDDRYKEVYTFSKDELLNFLLNYFDRLYNEFESDLNNDDLYDIINYSYPKKEMLKLPKCKKKSRMFYIPYTLPGKMDIYLAQTIADNIITRLLKNNIIIYEHKRSLSQIYSYLKYR